MRAEKIIKKLNIYDTLFVILLVISLLLRLCYFNKPATAEDSSLSYLIARHMYIYNEKADTYILDDGYGAPTSSPLYSLSILNLVKLYDDEYFLGVCNILIQIVGIFCLYYISSHLFNKQTGLIAALLFSFSKISFYQATFIWPPYLMQGMLYTAFALFTAGYTYKKNTPVILGIVCYILSIALYKAALALLPICIVVIYFILKKNNTPKTVNIQTLVISFITAFLCYVHPLFYILTKGLPLFPKHTRTISIIPHEVFAHLFHGIFLFFQQFYEFPLGNPLVFIFVVLITVISFAYMISTNKPDQKRTIVWILLAAVICTVTGGTLITSFTPNLFRYFTPAYGLFIILIAYALWKTSEAHAWSKLLLIPVILCFIKIYSYPMSVQTMLIQLPNTTAIIKSIRHPFVDALAREIIGIKEREHFANYGFFQVTSYKSGKRYRIGDTLIWAPLEKKLSAKFITVDTTPNIHYSSVTGDSYIIILCISDTGETNNSQCLEAFTSENPGYNSPRRLHTDPYANIFISKKV